jgi:long-chain acyl-CoA synthetase
LEDIRNFNCYEYWLYHTKQHKDYYCTEHWGKKTLKSEFLKQVDSLAAYAQQKIGLKRGDIYTVFLPTTVESFVAFYALNKIGVIINFIHPLTPPEQLRDLMVESGTKGIMILDVLAKKYVSVINELNVPCVVCSMSDYASPLRKAGMKIVEKIVFGSVRKIKNRDTYKNSITKYPPAKGLSGNGKDIAVYLNGGGTTGQSKTIKLTSFAINEIVTKIRELEIGDVRRPGEECGICVLPLFHSFGLAVNFHLPFCYAGRGIPMEDFDAKKFNKIMRKNKGDFVFMVGIPVMFRKLMAEKNFDGEHLAGLRVMFCGGDDVTEKVLDEFNAYLEKWNAETRLHRGYGLTEVASVCSLNTDAAKKIDSIGKALPGLRMEIWDENHKRVPNGTIGEIAISGTTMMEGYFAPGKPEDEGIYYDEEGTPWVLSGDLGYQDDDGFFFFSGRRKRLIIISGYNVYPTDIEMLVESRLPFIKEVCAVQGYCEGKPIVRAFVSFRKDYPGDEEDYKRQIIRLCEENLSKFSIPREIVVMEELPRTPMKKIDFMCLTEKAPSKSTSA